MGFHVDIVEGSCVECCGFGWFCTGVQDFGFHVLGGLSVKDVTELHEEII